MPGKRKKKLATLDKYIIFCFIVILIYTIVHITIFLLYQIEMTEIAALVYGAFAGEVLICALIKRLKLKNEHEHNMKTITEEVQEDDMAG